MLGEVTKLLGGSEAKDVNSHSTARSKSISMLVADPLPPSPMGSEKMGPNGCPLLRAFSVWLSLSVPSKKE